MTDKTYPPSAAFAAHSHADRATYEAMYAASVADPDRILGQGGSAARLDQALHQGEEQRPSATPMSRSSGSRTGSLNVAANCIDRHLATRAEQTAIIWEPDDPGTPARHITYAELHDKVCRMANVLKAQGVKKGDRVVLYMPMIPEAAYAMLASARIGAIHSIVFAGFSPDALANRINDSGAEVLITADHAPRGGKKTPLKSNADAALLHCSDQVRCLVVQPYRRPRRPGSRAATSTFWRRWTPRRRPARPNRWAPRIRSSSSTPRARPAARKA